MWNMIMGGSDSSVVAVTEEKTPVAPQQSMSTEGLQGESLAHFKGRWYRVHHTHMHTLVKCLTRTSFFVSCSHVTVLASLNVKCSTTCMFGTLAKLMGCRTNG